MPTKCFIVTKDKNLSLSLDKHFSFIVQDPSNLPYETIDVQVYHDHIIAHWRHFMGRVKIYRSRIVGEGQVVVQHFPLVNRSIFSHIKGDVSLKVYYVERNGYVPSFEHCDLF